MPLAPYTPDLYGPRNLGRFRSYPRQTTTPIPGAGYDVGRMVWGEQELNLWGAAPGIQPTEYGVYHRVPLLGLGDGPTPQDVLNAATLASQIITTPDATLSAQGPKIVTALDKYILGPVLDKAAARAGPYLFKYVVPVFAGLYLLSGLAAVYAYQANKAALGKRGVAANPGRGRPATTGRFWSGRPEDSRVEFDPKNDAWAVYTRLDSRGGWHERRRDLPTHGAAEKFRQSMIRIMGPGLRGERVAKNTRRNTARWAGHSQTCAARRWIESADGTRHHYPCNCGKVEMRRNHDDPATIHSIRIAKQTLRMPDAMLGVMGGPSKAQAREILRQHGIDPDAVERAPAPRRTRRNTKRHSKRSFARRSRR